MLPHSKLGKCWDNWITAYKFDYSNGKTGNLVVKNKIYN